MHHSNEQYHLHECQCKSVRAGLRSAGSGCSPALVGAQPEDRGVLQPVAPHLCRIATLSQRGSAGSGTQDQTLQKKRGATAMGHTGHFPWGNW